MMTQFRIAPLVAAVALAFFQPAATAQQEAPVAVAQAHLPAAIPAVTETGLGAWPVAPSSRPFDRVLTPEELAAAQPPADPAAPQLRTAVELATAPASLWERIRLGFGLNELNSPLVQKQVEWFVNRPDFIKRTVERSNRYLYHIVEEIQKRGMPTEIALLPVVESAFNPVAYSRAHASGIWQFIPSTGKLYGLQQNFWYDGRRDVMAATNAALDYLQNLYNMFGSWELALAAYNWGEGAVGRAIGRNAARGLPTDYLSLTMPNETRHYVPRLQAVKAIIADPARFGITLEDIPNRPYFTTVTTSRHMDVRLAARLADVPLDEFMSLNPGFSRPVIRANSELTLLVPVEKAETFRRNLDSHDEPLVSWQAYQLKNGDTLDRIAQRHKITVATLRQINSITPKRKIGTGSTILVPAAANAAPHLPDLPAPPVATVRPPKNVAKNTRGTATRQKTAARKTTAAAPAKVVVAQTAR